MFINNQYTFNQRLTWQYQYAMEDYYYADNIRDGDYLWTLIFGA